MGENANEKFAERIDPLNESANPEGTSPNLLRTHLERYMLAKKHVRGAVLDAACGFGYGSSVMAENPLVDRVVGMDLSGETIRYAVEHYIDQNPQNAGRVSFVTGDCENLGGIFGRDAFDNVVSFETIEHLNHPERFLEGVRQVLRDGVLMISTPLRENSRTDGDGRPVNPYHIREFTYGEMMSLLQKNGFSVDDVYFQEIFLGPFVKRIGGRGGPSQPRFGGKAGNALKNIAKDIFNSTPLIPELSSKPYRVPPLIGRTGTFGIYVAKPKSYTNA